MNKTFLSALALSALFLSSSVASAAVTVRYYNKDSKNYAWDAVCSGSKTTVKFGSSRTASTTIQGSGPCKVKTPKGEVTLKGGEKIRIKDGKITIE
jgi:hypothetical protein